MQQVMYTDYRKELTHITQSKKYSLNLKKKSFFLPFLKFVLADNISCTFLNVH